ncbi:MAG TPA: SMP-30/gluconolactonase/LRE family protein [Ktedonobacteraceae bacterium]|nr:SMP-30/gluconolactonase/LRE family protein [Ktedonobacteraceae bacterium]
MQEVEHVLASQNTLGEGACWNPDEQRIYWVDIYENKINRLDPASGNVETFDVGTQVGVLRFRASGGLVMGTKKGLAFWDEQQGLQVIVNPEPDKPYNRFNDGAIDGKGRFWANTMCDPTEKSSKPEGSLYRLDPDLSLHVMDTNLWLPNGIGWSPDQKTMYMANSTEHVIYAYDFDLESGTVSNRRDFIHTPENEGVPDGLTIDSDGYLWSARWSQGKISCFDPRGKLNHEIYVPSPNTSSTSFGGKFLNELYITSAHKELSDEQKAQYPQAGDLFRIKTASKGQPVYKFAG